MVYFLHLITAMTLQLTSQLLYIRETIITVSRIFNVIRVPSYVGYIVLIHVFFRLFSITRLTNLENFV